MKPVSFFRLLATSSYLITLFWWPDSAGAHHFQNGRSLEAGRLYIRNFGYKEYDAHQQNWAIVQDERGIIYVGNNWGVMEYDGVSWRHITTDKNSAVIALTIDSTGVVYVGAEQGLGYLAPDSTGSMRFISLEDRIPQENRNFADVWRVHATRHGVYFFTVKKLFLWAHDAFKSWPIDAHSYSQVVRDTLYYAEKNVGLMRVAGEAPALLPGGEKFATERMDTMFPYADGGTLLVGTRSQGVFLYDGASFTPFKAEADEFLKTNMIYSGTRLANGDYVFGTIRGGAAVVDRKGRWLQKLDMASGLRDQTVIFTFVDREGALWLSLLNGLARVEISSPFTRFGSETGLEGGVEYILRHQGILYAATHRGVYYLAARPPGQDKGPSFESVANIAAFSWSLFSEGDLLLAATDDGVYEIHGERAERIQSASTRAFSFYHRKHDPDHILVGLTDGLAVLKRTNGRWMNAGRVKDIPVEIRSIAGDEAGNLWLGTNVEGAFLVQGLDLSKPPDNGWFQATVTRFKEDKLPVGEVNVFNIAGRVVFGTERGIRTFDAKNGTFAPDSTYGAVFADTVRYVGRIVEDSQSRVWIFSRKEKQRMIGYAAPQPDGSFVWQSAPFRRIADVGIVFAIYPEEDGTVWIGGSEGIARYDPATNKNYAQDFQAIIRRVTVNGDSVIFAGKKVSHQESQGGVSPVLAYENNAMRFEAAATSYDAVPENEYQYRLEGFEPEWSAWTREVKKDYTNLPENDYRFRVRARNLYGHISRQDVFEFAILPPWYRTWWAYALYLVTGALGLAGFTNLQVKQYQRRAEEALQRERERASLREATLRAEAAELQARATEAKQEVEKEHMRRRIASDLHDEIGSNLSSIAMISQTLQRKTKIEDHERNRLKDIQGVAQQTANSMRDIVWFVNPANDSLDKLWIKMRETANLMLEFCDFTFQTPNVGVAFETDLNFRRNLFLIYKESLQNIVKHSLASKVDIVLALSEDEDTLLMQIVDDGVGFDVDATPRGNGLENFERRALEMGGTVALRSRPGEGTEVELRVKGGSRSNRS